MIIVSSAVFSLILSYYLVVSNQGELTAYTPLLGILSVSLGMLVAYVLHLMTLKLDQLYPWQTQTNTRLFIGFVLQVIVTFAIIFGCIYGYSKLIVNPQNVFIEYRETFLKLSILLCMVLAVYSVVYFAFYSYYSYVTLQIESVKQERKQIELQLKALKSQLSPHFLFNSLNTISSLAHVSIQKSELFIRELANMYRFTIRSYEAVLIPLKEELEFVTAYQYLLETRFEDQLKIAVDIPSALNTTKIPPLALQMLVENAVKHNTVSVKNPLRISIYAEDNYICVKNTITDEPVNKESFHIGLENISTRYLLLTNKEIMTSKGAVFLVEIPIIR